MIIFRLILKQSFPSRRFFDQLLQSLQPRCLLLCTHDPPLDCFSIRGRLGVKEIPCGFVLPQPFLVRRIEIGAPLFVGINAGLIFFARIKRSHPLRLHQTFIAQFSCAPDVDRAPNAPGPPRREPYLVDDFVNAFPNSVDPPEAERLIHRLWPSDAWLSRILFVKANPNLGRRRVILLQPGSEIRRRSKELRFQPICFL